MEDIAFVNNDLLLSLNGIKEAKFQGQFLSNATVTAVVKTLAGATVSGATFPVTLAAVSGKPGAYEGSIDEGLAIIAGTKYDIEVTVTSGGDTVAFFDRRILAVKRTGK